MASTWTQRLVAVAGTGVVLALSMCASPTAAGGDCEENDDCKSNRCRNGRCDGEFCICDGPDCRGRSTCNEGWVCVLPTAFRDADNSAPRCYRACTGPGTCPLGDHCETSVCLPGGEPFAIEWVSIPRTKSCAPRVPCPYKVRVPANVTVVKYSWGFSLPTPKPDPNRPPPTPPPGASSSHETTVPETTHTYTLEGTFNVSVAAIAADGAVARLTATETLCIAQGGTCEPGLAPCCNGQCTIQNKCPE